MGKFVISFEDIMKKIVSIEMTDRNDSGEGVFDVLTEDGYIYSNIPEAAIRDLRPELIY